MQRIKYVKILNKRLLNLSATNKAINLTNKSVNILSIDRFIKIISPSYFQLLIYGYVQFEKFIENDDKLDFHYEINFPQFKKLNYSQFNNLLYYNE